MHYYTYPNNYWENVVCTTYEITSFDGYINHRIYIKDHKNMKGEYIQKFMRMIKTIIC